MVAGGASVYEVADTLNAEGVPSSTGGVWYASVVARLVARPVYRGEWVLFRSKGRRPADASSWITIPAPSIVSPALWQRAQSRIQRRQRGPKPRVPALLTSLARCAECGHRLARCRPGRFNYYSCGSVSPAQAPRGGYCRPARYHRAEPLEAQVWAVLVAWVMEPETLRAALEESSGPPTPMLAPTLRRALAENDAARERVRAAHRRGGAYTADDLERDLSALAQEREAISARLRDAETEERRASGRRGALVALEATCSKLREVINDATAEERRAVALLLVEGVKVGRDGNVEVRPRVEG